MFASHRFDLTIEIVNTLPRYNREFFDFSPDKCRSPATSPRVGRAILYRRAVGTNNPSENGQQHELHSAFRAVVVDTMHS